MRGFFMRISKVEVSKGRVTVGKDYSCGYIEHQNIDVVQHKDQNSIMRFLRSKEQNFTLSLLNKTLLKEIPRSWGNVIPTESQEKKDYVRRQYVHHRQNLSNLRKLLQAVLKNDTNLENRTLQYIKRLRPEEIIKYFHPKFTDNMVYSDSQNNQHESKLSELLHHALQKNEAKEVILALSPYQDWVKFFITTKQEKIAKSIVHNKILVSDTSVNDSSRKIALKHWANDLVNNTFDFQEQQNQFELSKLVQDITIYFNEVEKFDENNQEKRQIKDFPKNYQDFKCGIKETYKNHRRYLCQKNALHNNIVQQYSLEVGKYLDLYFPVKKSAKRLSLDDIKYYLKENTIKTRVTSQIYNATLQYIIQQGKFIHYNLQSNTDSQTLQYIKAQEVFALKFIDACTFATNNLRNAVDPLLEKDILGKKVLISSLQKNLDANSLASCVEKLFDFFYLDNNAQNVLFSSIKNNDLDSINFCGALRTSIQRIRNQVLHFKQTALNEFLTSSTPTKYEKFAINPNITNNNVPSADYTSSPLKELLKIELEELPFLMFEKLQSSLVLEYYNIEDLHHIFSHQVLHPRILHFIPSFKKVFSQGRRIQNEANNPYNTTLYFHDDPRETNQCIAHKNALHLVYENKFMQTFLSDNVAFYGAIHEVIKANKNINNVSNKNHKYAFQQIEVHAQSVDQSQTPIEFLIEIQSILVKEENIKRDEGKLEDTESGHFQNFLYYLFMKAFDTFIQNNINFHFIMNPCKQEPAIPLTSQEEIKKVIQALSFPHPHHTISDTNSLHIALWTFAKLLDMNHLNELSNQISKLKQFEAKFTDFNLRHLHTELTSFQEVLHLCMLSSEKFYDKTKLSLDEITPYIDPQYSLRSEKSPYVQSDNHTPVLFSQLKLVKRYATENILKKALSPFLIKGAEIEEWILEQNNIASHMEERQKLHKNWATSSKKKGRNDWFSEASNIAHISKKEKYKSVVDKIETYNWLDNKIHLVHIKKLHNLLLELLSRLAGFVALWERDFHFISDILSVRYEFSSLDFTKGLPKICNSDHKWQNFISTFFVPACASDFRTHRNFIAHFNYLTQFNDVNSPNKSLLELIDITRQLVSYDRKLKNAVTKSIIDIIDRHGIEITFKPLFSHNHQLVIEACKPKKIMHLKHKELCFNQINVEYANMVKSLLEYK